MFDVQEALEKTGQIVDAGTLKQRPVKVDWLRSLF